MFGIQASVNATSSDTLIHISQDECQQLPEQPILGELYSDVGGKRIIELRLETVPQCNSILNTNGSSFGYEETEDSATIFVFSNVTKSILEKGYYENRSRFGGNDSSKLGIQNIDKLDEIPRQNTIEDFMYKKIMLLLETMKGGENRIKVRNLRKANILTPAELRYLSTLVGE